MWAHTLVGSSALAGLSVILFGCGGGGGETPVPSPSPSPSPPVFHFVAFAFDESVDEAAVAEVREAFLKLKAGCLKDGKAVISEVSAGDQSSPENVGQGYTQGHMVKFPDYSMRDYYVGCLDKPCQEGGTVPTGGFCAAHDDFKVLVGSKLATTNVTNTVENYNPGALVFDYQGVVGGDLKDKFTHSVFFRFKLDTTQENKEETRTRFLALKNQCEGMTTAVAGDQNSNEPVHQKYEQGYFLVFESAANLEKYLGCIDKPCQDGGKEPSGGYCKAHDDFKRFVGPLLNTADRVTDLGAVDVDNFNYHPGVFVFDFAANDEMIRQNGGVTTKSKLFVQV